MKRLPILLLALILNAPLQASIIKKPPTKVVEVPYAELTCSDADRLKIGEIIRLVNDSDWLYLAVHRTEVYEMGSHIDHVHPMKFVTTILNNPELKAALQNFWPHSLKRWGFLDGLITKMNSAADRNKLYQYIEPFAKELNVTSLELKPFFESKDWEGMIFHLIR